MISTIKYIEEGFIARGVTKLNQRNAGNIFGKQIKLSNMAKKFKKPVESKPQPQQAERPVEAKPAQQTVTQTRTFNEFRNKPSQSSSFKGRFQNWRAKRTAIKDFKGRTCTKRSRIKNT